MFISFNMFIGLIILTIIMIVLIIYLTLTAKGSNENKKTNNYLSDSTETPDKQPTFQESDDQSPQQQSSIPPVTSHLDWELEERKSNPFLSEQPVQTTSYNEPSEKEQQIPTEDDSLRVLPYPKDDEQKETRSSYHSKNYNDHNTPS